MKQVKVSLMIYEDFEKPIPILKERIKIRMRDQYVDFFTYTTKYEQQPIYRKSTYMPRNNPRFKKQALFDRQLLDTSLDFSGYGPSWSELSSHLEGINLEIPKKL